jgi:unsaturated rhamnogalacturonyl hydrolase
MKMIEKFFTTLATLSCLLLVMNLIVAGNTLNEKKGKVVTLDYYFNHELKKDSSGKEIQFHYTWQDKENSGYSELGGIIENLGSSLYEIRTAPTFNGLKNTSIYIIVDPDTPTETAKPNYIDDQSIKQIVKWVKAGGVLMLMGNDRGNCEFEHLNNLAEKFGIHFNGDSRNKVEGAKFDMGKFDVFPDHPIFKGIKKIYLKEISTLSLKNPAKSILTDNGDVIMAGSNYGKGFVFAVGDPWLYDEYIDNRILPVEFENHKAGINLFKWLLLKAKAVKMN